MRYDVFISYSRKDTAIADQICAAFDKAGISCFIDRQGIGGGMEFPKVLAPAIRDSEVFLFLASANAYDSPFTNREILYAFNKKRGEKMLPYIIDSNPLPDDLEFVFASTNWRVQREHPIDTVLVDDVLRLLGRQRGERQNHGAASEQESAAELYEKGRAYYDNKQFKEAYEFLKKAAEQGYAAAQNHLGVMYAKGEGVSQDKAEAVRWYRKATEQGYAAGQNSLGLMYYNGYGVSQDKAEAVRWIRKAAEQGNADAQNNLGVMYSNGYGVSRDKAEAVRWYRKAAEQGNADAQNNLGVMYYNGEGVSQDKAEAVRWYRKAAEQGNAFAQNNLGLMYEDGEGVSRDKAEAVRWFRKAAEQGYAAAQYNLGLMYQYGYGVSRDKAEAVRWYRKAAEQGHEKAQAWLKELG